MAANRLRLFPRPALPSLNGNGKARESPEAKGLVFAPGFVPIDALSHTMDTGAPASLGWYRAAWLPYACMRYRATKLVEAPLWIREETDDGEEWLEGDHPLAEVLERPNPDMEMSDLLELSSLYLDSTGACLWVKTRNRAGGVARLYPFSAEDFRVHSAGGRLFGRFEVHTRAGTKDYPPEEVVFFRNADPADPHGAVAPLHAALARLGIDRQLVKSLEAGLRNAVVPGFTLSYEGDYPLNPEQLEELKASLAAGWEGARNHGKPMVTGALKATQLKLGFDKLNGGELSKEVEAAVCAVFQVPPAVIGAFVGLENSSDRHNMETAVGLFYDNAIRPTWSRFEKALTRQLLREVDPDPMRFIRFDTSGVAALQEDQGEKAIVVEKTADVLTVNERRVMLGYPPLEDERGDEIVGGQPAAAAPGEEPEPVKRRRGAPERKAVDLHWALFDAATKAQEFGWTLAAARELTADRDAVLSILRRASAAEKGGTGPSERKDPPPFGPADAEVVRRLMKEIAEHLDLNRAVKWRDALTPLIEAGGAQAVERLSAELGLSFDLLQPGLVEYTQKEAAWLVTQVTDTTKQAVRDALSAGLLEGESIPDLAKRIEGLGAFDRSRAELIATTETTRVTNGAQRDSLAAYQAESGNTIRKSWLTARDSRVRDAHRALEGETRGIDEPFSNGLQAPGEPRCRCTLLYEMTEDAA